MTTALIWIIVGIVLVLSELLATSIVAVFMGLAAIIVGVLLHYGLIAEASTQFAVFGALSLLLLITIRRYFKRWFMGNISDRQGFRRSFADEMGDRVVVVTDCTPGGQCRVMLNGTQWAATSEVAMSKDDVAYIVGHKGTLLTVTPDRNRLN